MSGWLFDGVGFLPPPETRFDGRQTYSPELDCARLTGQLRRVYETLKANEGHYLTLSHLAISADCPEASAQARARDLRKPRWNRLNVKAVRRSGGTWVYGLFPGHYGDKQLQEAA